MATYNAIEWNHKKIKLLIDHFGHTFFAGKKILDLGCGQGDVAGALSRLGSEVICVDARQQHLDILKKKFPHIKTICCDLDNKWDFSGQVFDVTIDFGILCHLKDYHKHLQQITSISKLIILESEVCDSDDPNRVISAEENKSISDWSFNGLGCKPSANNIEKILREFEFDFKRFDNSKLNSKPYVYDWRVTNSGVKKNSLRRFWIATNKKEIFPSNPLEQNIKIEPIIHPPQELIKKQENAQPVQITQQFPQVIIQPKPEPPPQPIQIPYNPPVVPAPVSIQAQNKNYPYSQIKNLKTAVCISGHVRLFDKTYRSFLQYIMHPVKDFSVFMHTWETTGVAGGIANDDHIANIRTETKLNAIKSIINPTIIEVENYDVCATLFPEMEKKAILTDSERAGFRSGNLINYLSMLYSWKRSLNILNKYEQDYNLKFDLIIKLRLDEVFTGLINVKDFLINRIYVPNVGQFYDDGINDQFAIGDANSMRIYLSLFDNLIDHINSKEIRTMRPEAILNHHLKKNNVTIVEKLIPYYILRSNNTAWHLPRHNR